MNGPVVIDERSEPPLRAIIGELLVGSDSVDIAIARIRLAALDLTDAEVGGPGLCRVLLGHLDASTLLDAASGRAGRRPAFGSLANWLASDRLEVRSAGIGAWTPDFSIFRGRAGATTCLVGAHYFENPQLTVGPTVTAITDDGAVSRLLDGRFQELWVAAHDVAPAIQEVLGRAGGTGPGTGLETGPVAAGGAGAPGRPRGSHAP